jgi:FKBP-type peptidyl-prolyl cis-trans isomerase
VAGGARKRCASGVEGASLPAMNRQSRFTAPLLALALLAPPALAATPTRTPIPAPADVAAAPADAERTASGLATKVLAAGAGTVRPSAEAAVAVHYTGWTTDGKMFDSSLPSGKPLQFPVNGVIAGFGEALQLMVVGEKRRMWIPEALAYRGMEGKPKGMLVFDVELVKIVEPPATPPDVAAPPGDATTRGSGLASKVLQAGTGTTHPRRGSLVEVHYSGWTTDGKLFDSSVARGKAARFRLDEVIPGWTEGVQLMVEGERRRLWVPEKLAYRGAPGTPQGMLVFDVELLKIVSP